jgi:hypothetical protein
LTHSCAMPAAAAGSSAASVRRRRRERQQADACPKALGGDRRSGWIEAHKETILSVLKETPDVAIEEWARNLAQNGHAFGEGTTRCGIPRQPESAQRFKPASGGGDAQDVATSTSASTDGQNGRPTPRSLVPKIRTNPGKPVIKFVCGRSLATGLRRLRDG